MSEWGYKSAMDEIKKIYAEKCVGCPVKQGTPCHYQGCATSKQMRKLYIEEDRRRNQYGDGVVRSVKFNNYPVGKGKYSEKL